MKKVLVTGASGGVGAACTQELISRGYTVITWSSEQSNFEHPERIFDHDLSCYDYVLNCAGHGQGHHQGFFANSWQNQLSQIIVNYAANIFLFKHYASSRKNGRYTWISTRLALDPLSRPWQAVYSSSKIASAVAIECALTEIENISVLEVQLGATRSNFRSRSGQPQDEIEQHWQQQNALTGAEAAVRIVDAMLSGDNKILIQ
jgi:short-subunit dehydrogenase